MDESVYIFQTTYYQTLYGLEMKQRAY